MTDRLRYRLVDEPRPGPLSRLALPPLLVFLAATFFLPLGYLLIAINAVTLNGPGRNREIAYALAAVVLYFAVLAALNVAVDAGALSVAAARYLLVAGIGVGLTLTAFAYISQARAFELRRHLADMAR